MSSYLADYDSYSVTCDEDNDDTDNNIKDKFYTYIKGRNSILLDRYHLAKSKKVGETFKCAFCSKEHIKKQYSQAFCPKNKRNQRVCKNKFHNSIDESMWRDNSILQKININV